MSSKLEGQPQGKGVIEQANSNASVNPEKVLLSYILAGLAGVGIVYGGLKLDGYMPPTIEAIQTPVLVPEQLIQQQTHDEGGVVFEQKSNGEILAHIPDIKIGK